MNNRTKPGYYKKMYPPGTRVQLDLIVNDSIESVKLNNLDVYEHLPHLLTELSKLGVEPKNRFAEAFTLGRTAGILLY